MMSGVNTMSHGITFTGLAGTLTEVTSEVELRDSHQKRQSILATHGGYTRPNAYCSLEQRH